MIKNNKKRVLVTLSNNTAEKFEKMSKVRGLSKTELVSLWIDDFDSMKLENEQLKKQLQNNRIKETSLSKKVELLRKGVIK